MRSWSFKGGYLTVEVYENKHKGAAQLQEAESKKLESSISLDGKPNCVYCRGLKLHSKKEIYDVFDCFGPILKIDYNGISGKTIVTFDL